MSCAGIQILAAPLLFHSRPAHNDVPGVPAALIHQVLCLTLPIVSHFLKNINHFHFLLIIFIIILENVHIFIIFLRYTNKRKALKLFHTHTR